VRIRYELDTVIKPHVLYLRQTPELANRTYGIRVGAQECGGGTFTVIAGTNVQDTLAALINRINGDGICAASVTARTGLTDSVELVFNGARVPVTITTPATLAEWAYIPKYMRVTLTARKFHDASRQSAWSFDVNPPAGTPSFRDVSRTVTIGFRNVNFGTATTDTKEIEPEHLHGNLYYFQFVSPRQFRFFDF
jgi:hypothetical protein